MKVKRQYIYEEFVFEIIILAVVVIFFTLSLEYSQKARMFPWVVLIPLIAWFVFRAIYSIKKIRVRRRQESSSPDKRANARNEIRQEFMATVWLISALVLLGVFGMIWGGALFVGLYAKIYGKEGWALSILTPVGLAFGIYLLFIKFLGVPLFKGFIPNVLGF